MNDIQLLASHQIDQHKWDDCVCKHTNGLIYARSFYLDAICDHWSGIIIGDYRAVVPIPWRKKMGIRYAYIPPFIQQLGLIGETDKTDIISLIKRIKTFVCFGDFHFNHANENIAAILNCSQKLNLCINMSAGYTVIRENYRTSLQQILLTFDKSDLVYANIKSEDVITLHRQYYADRTPHVSPRDYTRLAALCSGMEQTGFCCSRIAKDRNGHVLAMILLYRDEKRIYNLLNPSTKEGKKTGANHWLLNEMLKEFAGGELVFDFEGSELPGVKKFYEKFGPYPQPYFHYHYNGLPWPLRLLKK